MAHGSRYRLPFKRRREGKTDYGKRIKLIDLNKYRLVVRISNSNVIVQIISVGENGDETITSAHSKELQRLGWLGGSKNISATYLTGYICGKKALKSDVDEAILDIGLKRAIKNSKVFAALKGAVDAGLNVPHGEFILPNEDRISGKHISDYAESLSDEDLKKKFSKYLERGLKPVDLPKHLDEIKDKINREF
ncbi:MAG: 50S ribosomal protein L18 [Methanobrevibacter sp.]|nr:50S ribosomal protein L18 [Candidatus Methanovirga aequatorialis]